MFVLFTRQQISKSRGKQQAYVYTHDAFRHEPSPEQVHAGHVYESGLAASEFLAAVYRRLLNFRDSALREDFLLHVYRMLLGVGHQGM